MHGAGEGMWWSSSRHVVEGGCCCPCRWNRKTGTVDDFDKISNKDVWAGTRATRARGDMWMDGCMADGGIGNMEGPARKQVVASGQPSSCTGPLQTRDEYE